MLENIRLAFHGIWGHKLRSILTMLGIIIGIAAIIAIVSTIQGTNEQIKQNLIGAGNNSVVVSLYEGDYPIDLTYYSLPDSVPTVSGNTKDEIAALREVDAVSAYHVRNSYDEIYRDSESLSGGRLYGIDDGYFDVFGYRAVTGRLFVDEDTERRRKVAILDKTATAGLFPGGEDPLGKIIEIQGEPFTVIGVVEQISQFEPVINTIEDYYTYMDQSAGSVFVTGAAWPIIYRFDEPETVAVRASSTDDMTNAGKKTADILNAAFDSSGTVMYRSENLLQQAKELQDLSSATSMQLLWIASISLLVGGIGVMNIMLVSVTERVREIGLKKALGARKKQIMFQFLTEAAALTSVGGIIGVAAGIGLAAAVSSITLTPSSISVPTIIIAVLFSVVIGIIFGMIPAVKAANQNPIEALQRQ